MKPNLLGLTAAVYFLSSFSHPSQAQIFQNNNTSCEDVTVVGSFEDNIPPEIPNTPFLSQGIACGRFNDDAAFGNADFPDCITQRDPAPVFAQGDSFILPLTNSLFFNTGAHGQNCINAGEPNAQFSTPSELRNLSSNPTAIGSIRYGSIATGNLDNGAFEDVAFINLTDDPQEANRSSVQSLHSEAQGGFGPNNFNPRIADNFFRPFPLDFATPVVNSASTIGSDRNMVLADCDGDGVDEAIFPVRSDAGGEFPVQAVSLSVADNDGLGLQDSSDIARVSLLNVDLNALVGASIELNNFDQEDDILDAVVLVNDDPDVPTETDEVVLCKGMGACNFDCKAGVDMGNRVFFSAECADPGNCDPFPLSVTSGDYNGDGLNDIAVSLFGFRELRYFFNNNGNLASWGRQSVVFNASPGFTAAPAIVATGRFSPEAVESETDEVVTSVIRESVDPVATEASTLEVVTTNGIGDLNAPTSLAFNPNLGSSIQATGLTVKDFDLCGGDDVIGLAQTVSGDDAVTRRASLFLNVNEAPVVTVSANVQGDAEEVIPVSGFCSDSTGDDRNYQWSVLSAPEGAKFSLNPASGTLVAPATEANTIFQTNRGGEYILELYCTDFCGAEGRATVQIKVNEELRTQGGCLASLNPEAKTPRWAVWGWALFLVPTLLFRRWGLRSRQN